MNKIYMTLKGRFFTVLKIVLLGVMIAGGIRGLGQTTYNLITSTTGLTAGSKYLIVSTQTNGTGFALGSQSANNRPQASITVVSGSITTTPASLSSDVTSAYEITLGGSTGAWTLFDAVNNGYLYAAGGTTNNYLRNQATSTTWTISFASNAAILTSAAQATRNILQYNSTNSLFSCYTSGQSSVYLYQAAPSCTPPTVQASFSSFANITTSQADINFAAGTGGVGRLIAAAAASSIAGAPSSGTAYTTGLTGNFSTTTPTIATGEKVIYKNNGTSTTVTGLSPETQYAVKVFEYNTSDCYITSGTGNTGSFYTLSNEPSAHAAAFSCNASAYNQIDLTFSAASTITNADGYIILQKAGSAPTGLPADASSYTVGNTIGDATVAAIVSSSSATAQSIAGLSASTNYYFTLIPYNALGTGTVAATYNYLTAATIPGSNCTTPVTPPGITVSAATLTGFTYVQSAGPSASQTYNVSGTNLSPASGNVNIAASTNYEVSTDNSTFSSTSVNIAYTGGALAATPVYVRLKAGLSVGSYNSEIIANSGGGAAAKNVTVSGTVTGSGTSNIIEDGDAAFYTSTINIPYTTWQSTTITNTGSGTNGSLGVFRFKIQDGGASAPDADALPTIVSAITFNYSGTANTIRTAAIFDGNTKVADVTTVNANSLVFSLLSNAVFTVADNGSQVLTLRVTFSTTVTDNDKLIYSVGAATGASAAASSQFGTISATSDNSTANDRNRIEVTADRLAFGQQPSTTTVSTSMSPSVTVKGTDVNNNLDLDYTGSINITSTGTLTGSPVAATASAGVATYASLTHTATGTGFTLTATTTGLAVSNSIVSSTFDITAIIYANNDYRSVTTGTWLGSGTATWERYTSATNTWASAAAPAGNTANNIYITNGTTITTGSSFGNSVNIKVLSGGTFNSTYNATANSVYIYDGGTLSMSLNPLQINNGFEIEDNGTFIFNYSANAASTLTGSLWNGTENFHPNSNFIIKDHKAGAGNYFLPATGVITEQTYNGTTASFGNLIIDLGSAGDNNTLRFNNGNLNNKILTHHDLIFRTANTGTNVNMYYAASALTINGNLKIESTFTKDITLSTSAIAATLTINGDLINESANAFNAINNTGGNAIITVNGNIVETSGSGKINLNASSGAGIATVINLKGDLSIGSNSLLTATSTTPTTFNFIGSGDGLTAATTQSISIASTGAGRNQYVNFFAKAGSYVQLADQDLQLGTNSTFTVQGSGSAGGTLDFNFTGNTPLNITGFGTTGTGFASNQAATLKISSPDGISATSGAVGNVQTNVAPTYNQTATFWYIGKANQVTGTGLTTGSTGKIIYVNLLDNTKTLTLTNGIGISNGTTLDATGGRLEIQKGIVLGTPAADFSGAGRLVMSDGEYRISTITAAPLTNYLPQLSGYAAYSLTGGTVNLNGANATQILSGTPNYYKLTFSGSNTLGSNYKGISSTTSVASGITVSETAVADVKSFALGGSGTSFTMTETGRYITDGGGTKPDAGGTYSLASGTTVEFANSSGAGVVRLGSPAIDYANVVVSGTNVSNTSTGTGIKFQSGGTFTVKSGAAFKLYNTAGFSNTVGSNATAISNLSPSNPVITLEAGDTIEYAGAAQSITNALDYQNFTLSGSGAKTAPSGILTIKGDFKKTGTASYTHSSGTVAFTGTAAQAYNSAPSITDFYNVTTSNAAGLTINNNLSIANELALTGSAVLKLAAGDITLKSSATKTASFAVLPTTASVQYTGTGLFSVERYINASRKWRFLSVNTATAQTINAAWQEGQAANANNNAGYGAIITDASASAPGTNGFDQYSYTPSMKYYDAAINDYTGVANTTGSIAAHDAYMTYVRGDRTCTPANSNTASTILRTKGTLKTGDQTYTVTNAGDFAAIGNPYASRVSISSLTMSGLQGFIYIWDPKIAGANSLGGFQTLQKVGSSWVFPICLGGSYTPGINVPMDSIESGQAFFVRAQSAGASLKFTESAKATGSHDVSFTSGQPGSLIAVLKNAAGDAVDGAVVQYADQNSNSTDFGDALKMANTAENVSIKSSLLLSIEQRRSISADDTVHINVTGYRAGNYQWSFRLVNMDAPGLTGFVKDDFLNTLSPLNLAGDNNISFAVSSAAGSYAADRFYVIFKPTAVVAAKLSITSAVRRADKSVKVRWKAEAEVNIARYEVQRGGNGISFTSVSTVNALSNGSTGNAYAADDVNAPEEIIFYRIKAVSLDGNISYSDVIKLPALHTGTFITVSPNPVKNKTVHLQAENLPAGKYNLQVSDNTGRIVYTGTLSVSGILYQKDIQLPSALASGSYTLTLADAGGKKSSQRIVIE